MGGRGNSDRFYFLGLQIIVDGDCSHEIKRKAMTNLDGISKIRDITLLTKVHIVKIMNFQVVTYGCESWTIKKAECQRIGAFELWFWRRLLSCLDSKRWNQSILKEINLEYSLEGLMLKPKLQYFGNLMQRTDSLEKTLMSGKNEGKRRRGWHEMAGYHHWLDGQEFERTLADSEGQESLVCCRPQSLRVRHDLLT